MTDRIRLEDRGELEHVLSQFDSETRRRGETYFRSGRVMAVECVDSSARYRAEVQGREPYVVQLEPERGGGWFDSCTCPVGFRCKHSYAAMKALLAEDNVGRVRDLSGLTRRPDSENGNQAGLRKSLDVSLKEVLGRALKRSELDYLTQVRRLFQRTRLAERVTGYQLRELGFIKMEWNRSEPLWPVAPETEHEFWLYLVAYARRTGQPIPPFMEPLADISPIEGRLNQWLRNLQVKEWQSAFEKWVPSRESEPVVVPCCDFRLWFTDTDAVLEYRPNDGDEFKPLKLRVAQRLQLDLQEGNIRLRPPAALLWSVVREMVEERGITEFGYGESESCQVLGVILAMEELSDKTVDEHGQPIRRRGERLLWRLEPAKGRDGDYRFFLALPDGTPCAPLIARFGSEPAFYLNRDGLFRGPAIDVDIPLAGDNIIPAPAVESPAGIRMMQAIEVDLPEAVKSRIDRVPMNVLIQCELAPIYPGSKSEVCHFTVVAESEDGDVREYWVSSEWRPWPNRNARFPSRPPKRPRPRSRNSIIVYDRSRMSTVGQLMGSMPLKCNEWSTSCLMRVTRKFPEIFSEWLQSLPPSVEVQLRGELGSLANAPVAGKVRLDVQEKSIDWFDLSVVLDVADTELTKAELKLLLGAKGKWVRLDKKGWRRLEFNLSAEEDEQLAKLGLSARELSDEPQKLHALQLADPAARKFLPEDQVERVQRRASEIQTRVHPGIPPGITADMREYQRDGFHFLAYLTANGFGGVLADDMGLGKTLQTLTWIAWLRSDKTAARLPSLVVCPKSVMDNWRAEIERFAPGITVRVWAAGELSQFTGALDSADLHVINYNQLRSLGESIVAVRWLAAVLDEGQYIKNPNSQTAQIARRLNSDHRLVLTGTPIENRLLDLWSLMAFAMPGVLGSRSQFSRMFDQEGDPFARRRLASRVRPFLLRRTKSQVASDLPDRVDEDLHCTIEGEQLRLYRAELKRAQQLLLKVTTQKQLAEQRFHLLTSLLRLRQICCHPKLVLPNSKGGSAKLDALLEQLEPLMDEGQKVLVFSQFVEMLKLLKDALRAKKWTQFYLAGDTENRGELVETFQASKGPGIFLISLRAGGFGLNLTAASYVFLFDPWWNPAVENQAIDRTHRIGQVNKVNAYRLLIKDSIEEKIRALQKSKSRMADDVLGEERFAQSLTLDDLAYLFAD